MPKIITAILAFIIFVSILIKVAAVLLLLPAWLALQSSNMWEDVGLLLLLAGRQRSKNLEDVSMRLGMRVTLLQRVPRVKNESETRDAQVK